MFIHGLAMCGGADDNGGEEQCEENIALPTEIPIMTSIMRVEMCEGSSTTQETHPFTTIGLQTQLTSYLPTQVQSGIQFPKLPHKGSPILKNGVEFSVSSPPNSVDQSAT